MQEFDKIKVYQSKLSEKDFLRIANYVEKELGIKMPLQKIIMVQNRLYKRLIALQIPTFDQYVKYLFSPQGVKELHELANVLTTNKTDFFRENDHFDFLAQIAKQLPTPIQIWSAACSSGEEVYSIAITLHEAKKEFHVLGTDISERVLDIARKGVYNEHQIMQLPKTYLTHFNISIENENKLYEIKPYIRNKVEFKTLNLMSNYYNVGEFDIIFLRNVLIYFKSKIQLEVLRKLLTHLKHGGYLFLGHSESILDFSLPLSRIAPSVYTKK